jgi:hypothetical protein
LTSDVAQATSEDAGLLSELAPTVFDGITVDRSSPTGTSSVVASIG